VGTRGDVDPMCALVQELLTDDDCRGPSGEDDGQKHKIDFFIQRNLKHLAHHLLKETKGNSSNVNCRLRLHEFPFTNRDFYSAVGKNKDNRLLSSTATTSNKTRQHADPRMKSVSQVADVITNLILPCYGQVEAVVLKQDINLIITASTMTRSLAFLLAKIHEIPVMVLNLQPTIPNSIFPNYRVSASEFVKAIQKQSGDTCHKEEDQEYEMSYWRLEKAMEDFFLRPSLDQIVMERLRNDDDGDNGSHSQYYSWNELEHILSGYHPSFVLVNAYSNHLVPSLEARLLALSTGRNIYDVGSLADAYCPPGSPSNGLVRFLDQNDDHDDDITRSKDVHVDHCRGHRPIVCIGFGSMMISKPVIFWRALQILHVRAVLVGGCLDWSDAMFHGNDDDNIDNQQNSGNSPSSTSSLYTYLQDNVYHVHSIPYAYLLSRCAVMVCHGGAGTVHACLRAGIPCIISPILGDQFAWGALVQAKGLGLMLSRSPSECITQDIVDAIGTVLGRCNADPINDDSSNNTCEEKEQYTSIRERCRLLGETIRKDPLLGVQKVAKLINEINT
jgi:hypothetical protein